MKLTDVSVVMATSFIFSMALCRFVWRIARRKHLVDVPNERSLHKTPIPRLGGIAIVTATTLVLVVFAAYVRADVSRDLVIWLSGALAIALLGLADDLHPISARIRIVAQLGIAGAVVATTLGDAPVVIPGGTLAIGKVLLICLVTVYVVGVTNIYNFMDGMDGLASVQAVGVGVATAGAALATGNLDIAIIALVISSATVGFLMHNAPPASLFMGDAGSTFLGFTFATLGWILASRATPAPALVPVLALSPFLLDGTFTIVRRLSRGEAIWKAHRTHLYQRAVATGLSHREVLMVYAAWIAVVAACALRIDGTNAFAVSAGIGITLAFLAGVWRWVVSREARSSEVLPG